MSDDWDSRRPGQARTDTILRTPTLRLVAAQKGNKLNHMVWGGLDWGLNIIVRSPTIPQLPQQKELYSYLIPYHAKLVGESFLGRKRPVYECTDAQMHLI
ncbi:hypothetical protein CsSME_00051574 [Camellia sinensis var. sinensis]